MPYFTQDFLNFFKELAANNQREWFHENKKRYEQSVKKPFQEFVQIMIDHLAALDPRFKIDPKEAIFRINRDIRFSPDKTPYKTHMSAIISPGGKKNKSFYFAASLQPEIILKDNLPELVLEYYLIGKPLTDFFTKAMLGNK